MKQLVVNVDEVDHRDLPNALSQILKALEEGQSSGSFLLPHPVWAPHGAEKVDEAHVTWETR